MIEHDPALLAWYQQVIGQTGPGLHVGLPPTTAATSCVLVLLGASAADAATLAHLEQMRAQHADLPIIVVAAPPATLGNNGAPHHLSAVARLGIQGLLFAPLHETEFLQTITDTLRQQQHRHLHQRLSSLHTINELVRPLFTLRQPDDVYRLAVDMVARESQATSVALFLHDTPASDTMRVAACHTSAATFPLHVGQQVPLHNTPVGQVVAHQQALSVAGDHPATLQPADQRVNTAATGGSTLYMPLLVETTLLGVLSVSYQHIAPTLHSAEHRLLRLLADQIADAIRHVQEDRQTADAAARRLALMQHATDGILLLDSQARQILDANPAAEQLSGYNRAALLTMHPEALLFGFNQLLHTWQTSNTSPPVLLNGNGLAGSIGGEPDSLLLTSSGHRLPIWISISRIPYADEQFWLIIIRNMHDSYQIAQQLIQNEKLAAVGRLMSCIAHEINNPLQAIQNSLHLLVDRVARSDNGERRQRYLMMAREEVAHLSGIVQRMLDIYRPSREGMRPTDLHNILQGVLYVMQPELEQQQIDLRLDLAPDLPLVKGIASHLKQVYISLIANAMQAMPNGGSLIIRTYTNSEGIPASSANGGSPTPPYTIGATLPPGQQSTVVVEFTDSGQGIPAETLPHVFEPFYTTRANSLGLSLSISYSIIEQHKGTLVVRSDIDQGSTFQVCLPVAS